MILVRIVSPPQTPPLSHARAHWLEVSALRKPGYKSDINVVIDIRDHAVFWSAFPWTFPYWDCQFSTSADNNTHCVGALRDSGQGGLVFIQWMCVLHCFYCIIYIPGPHGNSSALYTD